MDVMDALTAVLTITLPIIVTIVLTNRQTQRVLRKLECCLVEIGRTQRDIQRCLLKLDFGFRANAAMHGWCRVDDVGSEQVSKLPEPKVYDEKLGVCYYKPAEP